MLKYLRIAVTALCLTACVLLVALWVRSYSRADYAHCPWRVPRMLMVDSYLGRVSVYTQEEYPYVDMPLPSGWGFGTYSIDFIAQENKRGALDYWLYTSDPWGWYVRFPHWLPVLTTAVVGATCGLFKQRSFSLRTLLIATTLVAAGLGLIVLLN
jgi:hypothetical protein